MTLVFTILFAFISTAALAAQPLVQYSWHNQMGDSQFVVFDDGSISHLERQMYEIHRIPETKFSAAKLKTIKKIVAEISSSKVDQSVIESGTNSFSGTIEVFSPKGMLIVEGAIKDIHDPIRAKAYKTTSDKMAELKDLIFEYTQNDMEL